MDLCHDYNMDQVDSTLLSEWLRYSIHVARYFPDVSSNMCSVKTRILTQRKSSGVMLFDARDIWCGRAFNGCT
jgi:hypothetical protein